MLIVLSKGHNVYNSGRFDPGAVSYPYVEADIVDRAVDLLIIGLRAKGHTVIDITPKDQHFVNSKAAHRERAARVNRLGADLYLDIHLNSGGGTGPEMWVAKPRGIAYDYARKLVTSIHKETGLRNRGVKIKPGMWSLSMTTCPAIIVEGGFIDSKRDMPILTPEKYAECILSVFSGEVEEVTDKDIIKVIKQYEEDKANQSPQKWMEPAIAYVEQAGLMQGYEDGSFRPHASVTRGELAQVLYNMNKK